MANITQFENPFTGEEVSIFNLKNVWLLMFGILVFHLLNKWAERLLETFIPDLARPAHWINGRNDDDNNDNDRERRVLA